MTLVAKHGLLLTVPVVPVIIIAELPRTQLVTQKDEYIYATVKPRGFGFIDDVEFYLPDDEQVIHFRSAARSGHYDFGVNRKQIEKIKKLFNQRN